MSRLTDEAIASDLPPCDVFVELSSTAVKSAEAARRKYGDRTIEIARLHRATVLENRFINYAKQFQWALEHAPITASWVMRLATDEIIEAPI